MDEVRDKQTEEVVVQGENARLEYKKGQKTYFEHCPAGVVKTVGSTLLCGKPLSGWVCMPSSTLWKSIVW